MTSPTPATSDDAATAGTGDRAPSVESVAEAVAALRRGGLVGMPTETVYGLGADASDPEAVARVFAAKGRPADHPLIVHLADADRLDAWAVDVPDVARRVAERFWPGPLTMILRRHPDVPAAVTGGQDTIGLRVPSHPVAHALLEAFGGGVAAPSANRFGRVSPTTREAVLAELGDAVDVVLEGGACEVGLESTIVDLSGERPRLLRPGAISAEALAEVIGDLPTREGTGAPRTPGRLPSHYAPSTPVRVVDAVLLRATVALLRRAGQDVVVVGPAEDLPEDVRHLPLPADPAGAARRLYRTLADVDRLGADVAVVQRPPAQAGWEAVHDRLGRAEGVDPHAPRAVLLADGAGTDPEASREAMARATATVRPDGPSPALLLGAWHGPLPGSPADLDALTTSTGRRIHLGPALAAGSGWAVRRLDASDANLGIPVSRAEVLDALVTARPATDDVPAVFRPAFPPGTDAATVRIGTEALATVWPTVVDATLPTG